MSLHDRPTLRELLEAVRSYISDEVADATSDRRARFRALVAANVLAIVERELANAAKDERDEDELLRGLGLAEGSNDERRRELARRIRAGLYDDDPGRTPVFAYARSIVARKLAVSNPRFLARLER